MKQKTAMMQLIEKIKLVDKQTYSKLNDFGTFDEYLQEEKEQIRLARLQGTNPSLDAKTLIEIANDYYNETYKQD